MDPSRSDFLRIDVRGKSAKLWKGIRQKLIGAIGRVLDSVIDVQQNTTVREESRRFTSALLEHARERLAKAGLENDKIEGEIYKLYAEREKALAEAHKTKVEGDNIAFELSVKQLRLALGATKAILIGEEGQEALLLGQQIDTFLEILRELAAA